MNRWLALVLLATTAVAPLTARAQVEENERPPPLEPRSRAPYADQAFAFEFPLRAGIGIASERLHSQGVAPIIPEVGPEIRVTMFRYFTLGLGFRAELASDKSGFALKYCEYIGSMPTGQCGTFKSTVSGMSFHVQAGTIYRWAIGRSTQGVVTGSLGYRYLDLTRRIDARRNGAICVDDCFSDELDTIGSFYISPTIELIQMVETPGLRGIGLQLGGDVCPYGDFIAASWLGLLFKFW